MLVRTVVARTIAKTWSVELVRVVNFIIGLSLGPDLCLTDKAKLFVLSTCAGGWATVIETQVYKFLHVMQ